MATKANIILCVLTLLIQSTLSLCIGTVEPVCAPPSGYDGLTGCAAPFMPPSSFGGSFVVTSSSPIVPTGISVVSDNVYEGSLCASGNLPLLGSVDLEGEFPTAGAGAVSYGCGDDGLIIVAEEGPGIVASVIAAPLATAPGYAQFINGYGLGCGMGYNGYRGTGYGSGIYGIGCSDCGCSL